MTIIYFDNAIVDVSSTMAQGIDFKQINQEAKDFSAILKKMTLI